jgi:cathepsin L
MMAMHRTIRFLTPLSLAALAAAGSSSPPRAHELDGSYTYSQYTSHFNKSYSADEYERRSEIFERNLRKILDHNAARADRAGIGGYLMGVNEFTDRETTEVKLGWNKLMHFAWRDQFRKNVLLLEEKASVSAERFLGGAKSYSVSRIRLLCADSYSIDSHSHYAALAIYNMQLPFDFEIEPISSLPASVDWTDIVNPAPSQGCGDCWAYAATACIESHLAMATANLMQLSYVNMLECTPNPERCGGKCYADLSRS